MVRTTALLTCTVLLMLASGMRADAGPVQRFYPRRDSAPVCGCRSEAPRSVRPAPVLRIPWFGRTLTIPSQSVLQHRGPVQRFYRHSSN